MEIFNYYNDKYRTSESFMSLEMAIMRLVVSFILRMLLRDDV